MNIEYSIHICIHMYMYSIYNINYIIYKKLLEYIYKNNNIIWMGLIHLKEFKINGDFDFMKNGKKWKCAICNYETDWNSNLIIHFWFHTGSRLFKCNRCDFRCTASSYLNQHLRIHTGEKPFQCKICPKKFTHTNNLKAQMVIHTGERPFKCEICYKTFNKAGISTCS